MQSTIAAPAENSLAVKTDERAGKYLTFLIGKEEFGVGVLKVREIMGIQDITSVPKRRPTSKVSSICEAKSFPSSTCV
jgi:purine-binding chemotaxis protein CheW